MKDKEAIPAPGHLLLLAVRALVAQDTGVPGFMGRLAIGVRGKGGQCWCVIALGASAQVWLSDKAEDVDALLLVDDAGAAAILGKGSFQGAYVEILGNAKLLSCFVERYVKPRSFVAVRASQAAAKPFPRKSKRVER